MAVSMPALPRRPLSHRGIVELAAGEWGLMVVRNSAEEPCPSRKDAVLSSYAFNVYTGHSLMLWGKAGKKKSVNGLDWRDCFASLVGRKTTPSRR